jgi:hypothetical protein
VGAELSGAMTEYVGGAGEDSDVTMEVLENRQALVLEYRLRLPYRDVVSYTSELRWFEITDPSLLHVTTYGLIVFYIISCTLKLFWQHIPRAGGRLKGIRIILGR